MTHEESFYPVDWMRIAEKELGTEPDIYEDTIHSMCGNNGQAGISTATET